MDKPCGCRFTDGQIHECVYHRTLRAERDGFESDVGQLRHKLGEAKADLKFCSDQRTAHIKTINDLRYKLAADREAYKLAINAAEAAQKTLLGWIEQASTGPT